MLRWLSLIYLVVGLTGALLISMPDKKESYKYTDDE